jgi:hypothetical protein
MAGIRDECDVWQHAWFPVAGDWTPPHNLSPMTARCERCGSERRYGLDLRGQIAYRRYLHTAGWVTYTAGNRPDRADLRLAWVQAHITEARKARKSLTAVS